MARSIFQRFMHWYDESWRRRHNVEKIDELISLSFENYTGERHAMNDGTWIETGDRLAILHFNRECFNQGGTGARDYARSGLRFRKLLMASFSQLALRMDSDERFKNVKAFHGVSWIPPHGERVGFLIERMPDSLLNTVRKLYFRILLKAFFPTLAARENNRLQPYAYWLTRQNLFKYFSGESQSDEIRINGKSNNDGQLNAKKSEIGRSVVEAGAVKSAAVKPVIPRYSGC